MSKMWIGFIVSVVVGVVGLIVSMHTSNGIAIVGNWNRLIPLCQWSTVIGFLGFGSASIIVIAECKG